MLRFLTLGSMTGGFLIISPGLRGSVLRGYALFVQTLNELSPWSYIAIGGFIFVALTMELYRYAIPKNPGIPKE